MNKILLILLLICCGCATLTGLSRQDIIDRYGEPDRVHKSPTHEGMVELLIYDNGEIVTVKNGIVSHIMR